MFYIDSWAMVFPSDSLLFVNPLYLLLEHALKHSMALLWSVCIQFVIQYKHILANTDQLIQIHSIYIPHPNTGLYFYIDTCSVCRYFTARLAWWMKICTCQYIMILNTYHYIPQYMPTCNVRVKLMYNNTYQCTYHLCTSGQHTQYRPIQANTYKYICIPIQVWNAKANGYR